MKITGSKLGGTNRVGGAAAGPARGGGGFALQGGGGAREAGPATRAAGPSGVNSVDALLALQQMEGPLERRRRAVGRAGRILDVLDEVKLALLGGEGESNALSRLREAVRLERAGTEDAGLEGVLDEIELRAAVELAKRETRAA